MKADRAALSGDMWRAECPDCGWWIVLRDQDAAFNGSMCGQSPEEYFKDSVADQTCMCVPHRFRFGDPIDGYGYVSSVLLDVTPNRIQITGWKQPSVGDEVTVGQGKRFRVLSEKIGWYALEEIGVTRGPRARAKKYPGECPCGISAKMCDYHKDL